jgi:hypothetical protein
MREPTIERMLGSAYYKVQLSCGHSFQCSSAEVKRDQLFIGKAQDCNLCQLEREAEAAYELYRKRAQ